MTKVSITLICVLVFAIVGCRQNTPANNANLTIELVSDPPIPAMGQSTFIIQLKDSEGQPITDATVNLRGDMTHAGMQPEFGTLLGIDEGQYRYDFTWSMVGDWVITVAGTTADGTPFEQRFERQVNR